MTSKRVEKGNVRIEENFMQCIMNDILLCVGMICITSKNMSKEGGGEEEGKDKIVEGKNGW